MSPQVFEFEAVSLSDPLEAFGTWAAPVPRHATVRVRDMGLPSLTLTAVVEASEDTSVRILALTIEGSADRPVTAELLRTVRLGPVSRALRLYLGGVHRDGGVPASITILDADTVRESHGGEGIESRFATDDVLAKLTPGNVDEAWLAELRRDGPRTVEAVEVIRRLYLLAESAGLTPNRFVQDHLHMNSATASRWIATARNLGADLPENPRTRRPRSTDRGE